MVHTDKISLKTFWEVVEQKLAACSADELRAILRAMAQEAPLSIWTTWPERLLFCWAGKRSGLTGLP